MLNKFMKHLNLTKYGFEYCFKHVKPNSYKKFDLNLLGKC